MQRSPGGDARQDERGRRALTLLRIWRDEEAPVLPIESLIVLLRQTALVCPLPEDPREGARQVLALLALDPLPLICLPGTPGEPDPFDPSPAYVADPVGAERNLLRGLDACAWRQIQAAARRGLG